MILSTCSSPRVMGRPWYQKLESLNLGFSALVVPRNKTVVWVAKTPSRFLRHLNTQQHGQFCSRTKWVSCLVHQQLSQTSTESGGSALGQWQSCDKNQGTSRPRSVFVAKFWQFIWHTLARNEVRFEPPNWSESEIHFLEESWWSIPGRCLGFFGFFSNSPSHAQYSLDLVRGPFEWI